MLEGSKYQDIKLLGCVICHLRDDTQFEEFKVPREVQDIVLSMDIRKYLENK
jgi:hypothetical protein